MYWQSLIAQPKLQKILRPLMFAFGGVSLVWLIAAGYFFWNSTKAQVLEETRIKTNRDQVRDLANSIKEKQKARAFMKNLKIGEPTARGGIEFVAALRSLLPPGELEKINIRYQNVSTTPPPAQPAANPPPQAQGDKNASAGGTNNTTPAQPANGAQNTGATPNGWGQIGFDCELLGEYRSLTRFLERLAQTRYVVDITKTDWTRSRVDPDTHKVYLMLRLNCILYGKIEN